MTSIEDLNLEIAVEIKTENDLMLESNIPDVNMHLKKTKKKPLKKKKKPLLAMVDSKASSSSQKSQKTKKNPLYDISPLTKKKDKMPVYITSDEVLQLQHIQMKIFSNFSINPNVEFSPDEYTDIMVPPLRKPSLLSRIFCCQTKSKLSKWMLDGDTVSLSGDTYQSVKHKDLSEFEEFAIHKKLVNLYKKAPKLENLTINCMTDFELSHTLDLIQKVLSASNQFDIVNQLRISSLPDERLLWVGPQFIHSHFSMPFYNIVPKISPFVEILHVFRKYIDKGARREEIGNLLAFFMKKFEKSTEIQLIHLKFSSWLSLDDSVIRASSTLIWKIGFNLRELVLHFCGRKLTDYGVLELCDTIIGLKSKKLVAIGLGFDARNDEITDESLKKISETLLALSEKAFLRSVSVMMVSKPISDYGLWCLGQSLTKIADRLNNIVVLLGSLEGITDQGVKEICEGLMKCGKNLRSITVGFLSWEITKYGLRVIESGISMGAMSLDLFNMYYSNQGVECKERQELMKNAVLAKHKGISDAEIHIFLR